MRSTSPSSLPYIEPSSDAAFSAVSFALLMKVCVQGFIHTHIDSSVTADVDHDRECAIVHAHLQDFNQFGSVGLGV